MSEYGKYRKSDRLHLVLDRDNIPRELFANDHENDPDIGTCIGRIEKTILSGNNLVTIIEDNIGSVRCEGHDDLPSILPITVVKEFYKEGKIIATPNEVLGRRRHPQIHGMNIEMYVFNK